MKLPIITITALSISLTACGGVPARVPAEFDQRLAEQGASPAYIAGARDGCKSGYTAVNPMMTGYRKDLRQTDPDYEAAWQLWHDRCAKRMRAIVGK